MLRESDRAATKEAMTGVASARRVADPSARAFTPVRPPVNGCPTFLRALVKSQSDNTLTVAILDADGTEGGQVEVAKPDELRRSFYTAGRGDGVTYAYSTSSSRTADGTTQNIVPSYVNDTSELLIVRPEGGTGVTDSNGDAVEWQDLNVAARAWADEPA